MFENYVLRLVLWILVLHCLVFPMAVLANIILSSALALTSIVWMALVMTAYHLLNLLVFRTFYRSYCMMFPAFRVAFYVAANTLLLLLGCASVVLLPLLAALRMALAWLSFWLAALWEGFVLLLVRFLGRTPA